MPKTWEVRGMEEADTKAAVQAASNLKQTTAAWLTDAIREKIARGRVEVGEVIPPNGQALTVAQSPSEPLSPLELVQNLEAYERIMRLRGKPISPRAHVVIGVERLVHARLMSVIPPAPPSRRRPDASGKRRGGASGQATPGEKINGTTEALLHGMPVDQTAG